VTDQGLREALERIERLAMGAGGGLPYGTNARIAAIARAALEAASPESSIGPAFREGWDAPGMEVYDEAASVSKYAAGEARPEWERAGKVEAASPALVDVCSDAQSRAVLRDLISDPEHDLDGLIDTLLDMFAEGWGLTTEVGALAAPVEGLCCPHPRSSHRSDPNDSIDIRNRCMECEHGSLHLFSPRRGATPVDGEVRVRISEIIYRATHDWIEPDDDRITEIIAIAHGAAPVEKGAKDA